MAKTKKNNFTLEQLDAYARTLSSKQVNMLYENRLSKKYVTVKALNENESMIPDPDEYFRVFVPQKALAQMGHNNIQLTYKVCENESGLKHTIIPGSGIWFYTQIPAFYEHAIQKLVNFGYADFIRDTVEPDYQYILDETEELV